VAAENPVLVDRYARTPAALPMLVTPAEAVHAPVCDLGSRMNFANTHPLDQRDRMRALVVGAELILAIEPVDLWGALKRFRDELVRTAAPLRQPAGDMPPCGDKVLSDRQITDIIAFLKTVPRLPAVASIPLLP